MALNCRAGQLAEIRFPYTASNERLGLTSLNGHVVRTKFLQPDCPADDPGWVVDPPQWCRAVGPFPPGLELQPGEILDCKYMPDVYLRPFRDFSPEEIEEHAEELRT